MSDSKSLASCLKWNFRSPSGLVLVNAKIIFYFDDTYQTLLDTYVIYENMIKYEMETILDTMF